MEEYKKKTIQSYNKNAKTFAEEFKKLIDLNRRSEFQKFIDLISGKKILDLGCGAGDYAYHFLEKELDVTCIDFSQGMIDLCKEKGLNAFVMDIENLTFNNNTFNGIWAVKSLLHISKLRLPEVVNNLHKILKDKGILYVCIKEGEGERFIDDGDNEERFFAFWEKDEFLQIFEKRFKLLDFQRISFGKSIFLQFFFKKK